MLDTLLLRPKTSGRFSSLMELYEENYRLVRLLMPELRSMDGAMYLSQPDGRMQLELSQIEHNRYTTTFNLTYRFTESLRGEREPDLSVRIYHDARSCEVLSGFLHSRWESRKVRSLDSGYRLNRFLFKWLSYCIRQGHSFAKSQPEPSTTEAVLPAKIGVK